MSPEPREYRRTPADCVTVAASIHADCAAELRAFRARHNLTTSGAVHHLLREALGLDPLQPLNRP